MGVSNLTEVSNSVIVGNLLSSIGSPALVKGQVGMNLMYTENLPVGTNVKKFVKYGSLTGAIVAESTAQAADANGELTDTSVTATAAKCVVVSGLTVEAEAFSNIDLARLATEQFAGIARYVDNDFLSMASGLATSVTAATVLTVDDIMQGQFNIYNSNCPNQEVPLAVVIGPRAGYNIKKDIIQSGGSAWANPAMLQVFNESPIQPNGRLGSIPGVGDIYQTTGFATGGGDDTQMIIHPMWCIAGMFAPAPVTWVKQKGAEGFYTEVASYYFYDIIEWNDLCGCALKSDT